MPYLFADAVSVQPTSAGMPAAPLVQTLINWLGQVALWGSLASVLLGAAIYGISQHTSNFNGSYKGRQLAIAGFVGACLAGTAAAGINLIAKAAGA